VTIYNLKEIHDSVIHFTVMNEGAWGRLMSSNTESVTKPLLSNRNLCQWL